LSECSYQATQTDRSHHDFTSRDGANFSPHRKCCGPFYITI
jgi:hypothetical protein